MFSNQHSLHRFFFRGRWPCKSSIKEDYTKHPCTNVDVDVLHSTKVSSGNTVCTKAFSGHPAFERISCFCSLFLRHPPNNCDTSQPKHVQVRVIKFERGNSRILYVEFYISLAGRGSWSWQSRARVTGDVRHQLCRGCGKGRDVTPLHFLKDI